MPDHNQNLYVTLMGRYGGFSGLNKFNSDFSRLNGQFGMLNTKAQRQSALTEMALRKQASAATTAADVAVRAQARISTAVTASGDRIERMQRRLTLVTKQQIDLRQRAEQGYYDSNILRYTQMREKLKLQQEWITADLAKQLAKRDALQAAFNDAQVVSAGKAAAKIDAANRLASYSAPAPGMGAKFGALAMNPYVQGAAVTVGAGAYAAYKLSNYYAGFQKITQQTAANTNMSPAALQAYRGMLPRFRTQYPGSMGDVNSAFFRALNLGFRTKSGAPNQRTYQFVKEVMMSALPSGANPEQVANLLGGGINAYKGNVGVPRNASPDWFMNTLHAGGAAANMSVEELAQYFGPVMALAAASKSRNSLRQALASVGALTQQGFTPQKANTDVAQIFQKMLHPSAGASKRLAQVYYKTGGKTNLYGDFTPQGLAQRGEFGVLSDLQRALASGAISKTDLLTIFPGTRGGQALLSLLSPGGQQRTAANYAMTSTGRAQGQTATQYAGYLGTRGGQTAERNALLGQAGLWAGQGANKEITNLTSDFNKATIAVGGFVKSNQALIYGVAHSIGSLAAFALHMNPLYTGFKIVSGIIGVTNTLLRHGFVSALQDAGSRIKGYFLTPLTDLSNFVKPWGGRIITSIGAGITNAIPGLKSGPLHNLLTGIKHALGGLKTWAANLGGDIASGLGSQFSAHAPSWLKHALGINTGPSGAAKQQGGLGHALSGSGTYKGASWNVSGGLGTLTGIPSGFTGRWFGSSYGGVTSNALSKFQGWWANALGSPSSAGKIGDTDFASINGTAGNPYELPGNTKAKWTFVRYVSDPSHAGQDIAIWRDPMGNLQGFNHTDPRGIRLANGSWYHFSAGNTRVGGQMAGISMESHVCIVTTPQGRRDIMVLTGQGEMQQRAKGNKVQRVSTGTGTGTIGAGTPTPPAQVAGVGATGKGPAITGWEKNNWALLSGVAASQHIPMAALLAILGNESGGGMNKAAGANVMQMTPIAARQIGFTGPYGSNVGASLNAGAKYFAYLLNGPAHGDMWTAFEMYNGSGPGAVAYANKAYAAANAFGLSHQIAAAKAAARLSATPETGSEGGAAASGYGAAGRSVPVHIIGRCKAEADANKHRKTTADHSKAIAHYTSVLPALLREVQTLNNHVRAHGMRAEHGSERNVPKLLGLHQSATPGY